MFRLGRRDLLRGLAAAAVGSALPRVGLAQEASLGPLVPDPDGVIDLPAGFTYRILSEAGTVMTDGFDTPERPDGMGAFAGPDGTVVLMRNHELVTSNGAAPSSDPPAGTYRPTDGFVGGVTRLVLDATTHEVVSSNLVLHGTIRNCAGGVSPWGWLTCEESVVPEHGYVFLCPIDAESVVPFDLKAGYGRFNHEAAAVVPSTSVVYLTEDRSNGCLYRFVPTSPASPFEGTLQAAVIGDSPFDTGSARFGDRFDVRWIDLDETDAPADDLRIRAQLLGAAIFRRGEGAFFFRDSVYIAATRGGPADRGQIFRLPSDGTTLEVIGESPGATVLDSPDNICLAPWGDVIMAEDGGRTPHLRGVRADGSIYDFARNAFGSGEFAGCCFSPAGDALYVNMQSQDLTLVITGPFPEALPPFDGGPSDRDAGAGAQDASAPRLDGGSAGSDDGGATLLDGSRADAGTSPPEEDGGCACEAPGASGGGDAAIGLLAGAAAVALARQPSAGSGRTSSEPDTEPDPTA